MAGLPQSAIPRPKRGGSDSRDVYVADSRNACPQDNSPTGIIQTVVGNGDVWAMGDGGPATSAGLLAPDGITFDSKARCICRLREQCGEEGYPLPLEVPCQRVVPRAIYCSREQDFLH
jgi:hypothetical protein